MPLPALWLIVLSIYITSDDITPSDKPGHTCVLSNDANGPTAYGVPRPWELVLWERCRGRVLAGAAVLALGLVGWAAASIPAMALSTLLGLFFGGWQFLRLLGMMAEVVIEDTLDSVGTLAHETAKAAGASEEDAATAAKLAQEVAVNLALGDLGDLGED